MQIESSIALLPAISRLLEVQDVIQAIRAADAETRKEFAGGDVAPEIEPRRVIHPTPRYEPRPVIHPTPRYEPRQVIHPTPAHQKSSPPCDPAPVQVVQQICPAELPIQPPWQVMPWQNVQSAPKVKIVRLHPDICHKGRLLDFFL